MKMVWEAKHTKIPQYNLCQLHSGSCNLDCLTFLRELFLVHNVNVNSIRAEHGTLFATGYASGVRSQSTTEQEENSALESCCWVRADKQTNILQLHSYACWYYSCNLLKALLLKAKSYFFKIYFLLHESQKQQDLESSLCVQGRF